MVFEIGNPSANGWDWLGSVYISWRNQNKIKTDKRQFRQKKQTSNFPLRTGPRLACFYTASTSTCTLLLIYAICAPIQQLAEYAHWLKDIFGRSNYVMGQQRALLYCGLPLYIYLHFVQIKIKIQWKWNYGKWNKYYSLCVEHLDLNSLLLCIAARIHLNLQQV